MPSQFYRRNLPHIQPEHACFAITFRLYGSLPAHVITQYQEHRDSALKEQEKELFTDQNNHPEGIPPLISQNHLNKIKSIENSYRMRINDSLDNAEFGPTWLKIPEIAQIVAESIHFIQDEWNMYQLWAFCIMPNHVHLLVSDVRPMLHQVLQKLKRHTARQANKFLNRTGKSFWHKESYDHIVKSSEEFEKQLAYILNNPVKAGLIDDWEAWPYTYCKPDL